jgi:hypothetical protein
VDEETGNGKASKGEGAPPPPSPDFSGLFSRKAWFGNRALLKNWILCDIMNSNEASREGLKELFVCARRLRNSGRNHFGYS